MIDILISCILSALAINFVYCLFQAGMIFEFVRKMLWRLPAAIKKPLYDCLICMSFWYGMLFYKINLVCWMDTDFAFIDMIYSAVITGGINYLFTLFAGDYELYTAAK